MSSKFEQILAGLQVLGYTVNNMTPPTEAITEIYVVTTEKYAVTLTLRIHSDLMYMLLMDGEVRLDKLSLPDALARIRDELGHPP